MGYLRPSDARARPGSRLPRAGTHVSLFTLLGLPAPVACSWPPDLIKRVPPPQPRPGFRCRRPALGLAFLLQRSKACLSPNKRLSFHLRCRGCGRKDCGVYAVGWLGSARPRLPAAASPAVGTGPRNAPAVGARALLRGGWEGPSWPAHARLSFLPPGAPLLGTSVV